MIIGHEKQWEILNNAVLNNNLPHAIMFSGEEGIGKKKIALKFAALLIFNDDSDENVEKLLKGISPNFTLVVPEEGKIKVDDIRLLNKKLALSSDGFKIAIVDDANLMNPEAQNCFLKTLEEPKGKTVIILVAEHPEKLLETINSRAQQMKFYSPSRKEIVEFLEKRKLKNEEIEKMYLLSSGKPGLIMTFLESADILREREKEIKKIIEILFKNKSLAVKFTYAEELSKRENLKDTLNLWLSFFHYLILLKEDALKSDFIPDEYFKNISLQKIKEITREIQNTYFLIFSTNVNLRLALEILLMKI